MANLKLDIDVSQGLQATFSKLEGQLKTLFSKAGKLDVVLADGAAAKIKNSLDQISTKKKIIVDAEVNKGAIIDSVATIDKQIKELTKKKHSIDFEASPLETAKIDAQIKALESRKAKGTGQASPDELAAIKAREKAEKEAIDAKKKADKEAFDEKKRLDKEAATAAKAEQKALIAAEKAEAKSLPNLINIHPETVGQAKQLLNDLKKALPTSKDAEGFKAADDKIKELDEHIKHLEGNAGGLKSQFKSLFSEGLAVGAGLITVQAVTEAVVDFGKESIHAALESDKADALLVRSLQSVGANTAANREELEKQQKALLSSQGVTETQTKQIQAQGLAAGLTGEALTNFTNGILDYSAATGKDATAAAIKFSKSVKEGGDVVDEGGANLGKATKLFENYAGAANAAADTSAGFAKKASAQFEELQVSVGKGLLAAFDAIRKAVGSIVDDVVPVLVDLKEKAQPVLDFIADIFKTDFAIVKEIVSTTFQIIGAIFSVTFNIIRNAIERVVIVVDFFIDLGKKIFGVTDAVDEAGKKFDLFATILGIVHTVFDSIQATISAVTAGINAFNDTITEIIKKISEGSFIQAVKLFTGGFDKVGEAASDAFKDKLNTKEATRDIDTFFEDINKRIKEGQIKTADALHKELLDKAQALDAAGKLTGDAAKEFATQQAEAEKLFKKSEVGENKRAPSTASDKEAEKQAKALETFKSFIEQQGVAADEGRSKELSANDKLFADKLKKFEETNTITAELQKEFDTAKQNREDVINKKFDEAELAAKQKFNDGVTKIAVQAEHDRQKAVLSAEQEALNANTAISEAARIEAQQGINAKLRELDKIDAAAALAENLKKINEEEAAAILAANKNIADKDNLEKELTRIATEAEVARTAIKARETAKQKGIDDKSKAEQIKSGKDITQAQIKQAQEVLDTVGHVFSTLGTLAKGNFEAQKAFALAGGTVDAGKAFLGVLAASASSAGPLAVVEAGLVFAIALAHLKDIADSKAPSAATGIDVFDPASSPFRTSDGGGFIIAHKGERVVPGETNTLLDKALREGSFGHSDPQLHAILAQNAIQTQAMVDLLKHGVAVNFDAEIHTSSKGIVTGNDIHYVTKQTQKFKESKIF